MVLESNMFKTEQELPELIVNCIEIDNEKEAHKVVKEISKYGIFGVVREKKIFFTTVIEDDDFLKDRLTEVLKNYNINFSDIKKNCKKIIPEDNKDYFSQIFLNALRYVIYQKLEDINKDKKENERWTINESEDGVYICKERYDIDNYKICVGAKFTIKVFDNKAELYVDRKLKLYDEDKKLTRKLRGKINKMSVVEPKTRYEFIREIIQEISGNFDYINIKLSKDYTVNMTRTKLNEKLPTPF
ncbi:hypothetical protein [Saccharolobus islandicus]|uniref:Uncharacterized protein n=3 Tax=Saccharolobus islandicus TaxID=43080 RepID=C4KI00_SACI6|nr:hypothetical protein [Sulfolobus islandicus]ACP55410.1 hypothetical protein M1627_1527 [Sulfolobus islandicus M.16.27]ACR42214.1 hypothetical protein M164_1613 [Sulfolobus islandicus M.16.4]